MNLKELMILTLRNYDEEPDETAIQEYRERMTAAINEAYLDICQEKLQPTKEITVVVGDDGKIAKTALPAAFVRPTAILTSQGGRLAFRQTIEGLTVYCHKGAAKMIYIYTPTLLSGDNDVPVIDSQWHWCLSDFATWRLMCSGSRARQLRGEAYLNQYLRAIGHIIPGWRQRPKLGNKYQGGSGYATGALD